jgi:hypothetical protein
MSGERSTPILGSERTHRIVFDGDDGRPYCVLLQAAYGGDHGAVSRYFDSEFWHLAPTSNPVGVEATSEQLAAHNQRLRAGTDLAPRCPALPLAQESQ